MRGRKIRGAGSIAKGNFVKSLDQITALLKLDGKKERGGNIDGAGFCALHVGAAGRDIISPEFKPAHIGFAIQEIAVMLAHQESIQVDGVTARVVVADDDAFALTSGNGSCDRIAQNHKKDLVRLAGGIAVGRYVYGSGRGAR